MGKRYRSRRSVKKLAARSKRNFIITLIIVALLVYSTFTWVLPSFINSIGVIKNIIKPPQKTLLPSQNTTLAPPVLNILYEATNSSQINISGFTTPNASVKLYIDEAFVQTTDASGDGSFAFENVVLNLGTNNIYGKTSDDTGKESLASKTIKLIYNNEKPALTISEPDDNKTIQGGDKKVKVAGKTDPGVKVFVNGNQVIVDKDGNFTLDQSLNDGDNIISIKAVDTASNTTEEQRMVRYNPQETQ